jgi:2-dehydro-3-deoxyphosphogluconate aldolase / (4S)-4-hydroxy-2-oxoglutarate aldolase
VPRHLLDTGVVAIARAARTTHVERAAETLIDAGVTCIELTLTMPGALEMIGVLVKAFGSAACIGAGTVLTADQARACIDVGATFLVSPSAAPEVVHAASADGVPCLPGAFTPSEIVAAWASGAAAVKLFPASLGGARYLRDVRAPLPDIPLIPTGGVGIDDAGLYIAAGALAVGVGGPLFGDALTGGPLNELTGRAEQFLRTIAQARDTPSAGDS